MRPTCHDAQIEYENSQMLSWGSFTRSDLVAVYKDEKTDEIFFYEIVGMAMLHNRLKKAVPLVMRPNGEVHPMWARSLFVGVMRREEAEKLISENGGKD